MTSPLRGFNDEMMRRSVVGRRSGGAFMARSAVIEAKRGHFVIVTKHVIGKHQKPSNQE
jgi:hypothetical protein